MLDSVPADKGNMTQTKLDSGSTRDLPTQPHFPGNGALVERRKRARIYEPFPVRVSGVDDRGNRFEIETVLDNLSGSGLYLRMGPQVNPGDTLGVVICFTPPSGLKLSTGPRVAVRGTVTRVEGQQDGRTGLAMHFKSHRFV
jgi:hypothetical protein